MNAMNKTPDIPQLYNHFWNYTAGLPTAPVETQNYMILQVTESYYKNGFHTQNHLQCCDLEITYGLTNGLSCGADGTMETVDKSDIYLSFKGESHELTSSRSCRFQNLAIDFKDGPCSGMLEEIHQKFRESRRAHLPDIADSLTAIISEFLFMSHPFSLQNLDSLITSILVKLIRLDMEAPAFNLITAQEKLVEMVNYIDLHFLDIQSLDEFAPRFGYSYCHISKMFKKQVGSTPNEYLLTRKMEHAARLLAEGQSVSRVAEVLGYSTPYNFSRAFKSQYGVSPREFRK